MPTDHFFWLCVAFSRVVSLCEFARNIIFFVWISPFDTKNTQSDARDKQRHHHRFYAMKNDRIDFVFGHFVVRLLVGGCINPRSDQIYNKGFCHFTSTLLYVIAYRNPAAPHAADGNVVIDTREAAREAKPGKTQKPSGGNHHRSSLQR